MNDDVTRILSAIEGGDPHAAAGLLPLVYEELRKLAAQRVAAELPGQTLQATALVHEAYLRLVGDDDAGGQKFSGPKELVAVLKTKEAEFRRCLVEKLLTYALGRGLEYFDKCAVEDICNELARNDNRFVTMVIAIAHSDPFQMRRGRP